MRSHEDLPDLAAIEIPGESGTQEEEREAADAGDEDNLWWITAVTITLRLLKTNTELANEI